MNLALAWACALASGAVAAPPAVPLVTIDPYMSVWSMRERLTDDWPRHWSGTVMGMAGIIRVDGKPFRWCGPLPQDIPAADQRSVEVGWRESVYVFEAGGVRLTATFESTADDQQGLGSPVGIVRLSAASTDGTSHTVQAYLDVTGEWCTHTPDEEVTWSRVQLSGSQALVMSSAAQPVLKRAGDGTRIDWGRLYLLVPGAGASDLAVGPHDTVRHAFSTSSHLPASDDTRLPRAAGDEWPVLAATVDLGSVSVSPAVARFCLAYDEGRSVELFERRLRPLWAADNPDISAQIERALSAPARSAWITSMDKATVRVGGEGYAGMLRLAYRQVLAGHGYACDWDNTPLLFAKENTSNGCIATVDVIYPACPFFLCLNPELLKAQLRPLLAYAGSPRWKFPFAPHDMGTYPKANGQVYGGGESSEDNQMPVEESGNMLVMLAALARVEGNAEFCRPYLPTLERWAAYLQEHGVDPANQLCTDDFAGHLARNANLSAKTVMALGAYAQILDACGDKPGAERWMGRARGAAATWEQLSRDGDQTVLAFGKPGTWSQKYNLVWDRVLGLNLFPQEVYDRELALYRTKLQKFGLPLDSRRTYTKLDWTTWSACLTGRRSDFDAVMSSVLAWADSPTPPSRVPLTDWYETTTGTTMGMHTRTVVGGLWMPMLMDKLGVGLK